LVYFCKYLNFSTGLIFNENLLILIINSDKNMKKDIHPKYYQKTRVKCACGNSFTLGSTQEFIETEICSKCHPFYTGKEKVLDTVGQVQKFRKRLEKKKQIKNARKSRK